MNEQEYELLVVTNECEETFSLQKVPGEGTELVKEQKKHLSAELDLRRLVVNLDNTATLLYISYNALSGTAVQSKISGLQKRLSDLCAKSQVAMNDIRENTSIVVAQLPTVYGLLVKGKAPAAMQLLASCSKYAGRMAEVSEKLAAGFEQMGNEAQSALEGSQDLYASDLKKREEIKQQINEMRAKQESLKKQSQELQGTMQEVEQKYADAQRREETAEKNALIMGIVGACTSALTLGLSAFAEQTKSRQEEQKSAHSTQTDTKQQEEQKELQKQQKELEEKEEEVRKAKEELARAEEELAELGEGAGKTEDEKGETETAKGGETEEKPDAKKKEAAEEKVEKLKEEVAKAEESAEKKRKAVAAVQASLQEITKQLGQERQEMKDALQKAQSTTSELFQMKLDMQKENREIAGAMAEIAEKLKGQQEVMISTDKAVEMLKLAIRCLGNIVVAFTETALFWRNIEQGCNNLKDGAFITQVRTFAEFDEELQVTMYGSDDFKKTILVYMATWVALHAISVDYYDASKAVGQKVRTYIGKNLFENEAFEEASRLAGEIIQSMQAEQSAIDESEAVIERMRLEMSDGGQ